MFVGCLGASYLLDHVSTQLTVTTVRSCCVMLTSMQAGMFVCLQGLFELTACAVFHPEKNATIPLCVHTNTYSMFYILWYHSYRELYYRKISPFHFSVDSTFTLTLLLPSHHLIPPLLPLTFFLVSDSSPVRGIQTQTPRWRIVWMGSSPGCPKAKVPPRTFQMTEASRAPGQYKGSCCYYHFSHSQ